MGIGHAEVGASPLVTRGLDEASTWAALLGHFLERLGGEAPCAIAVATRAGRRTFVVSSTEDLTLHQAAAVVRECPADAGEITATIGLDVPADRGAEWSLTVERAALRLEGAATRVRDPSDALAALVRAATEDPDRLLSTCPVVGDEERGRLAAWGGPDAPVEIPRSVLHAILASPATVIDRHGRASFAAILARASALGDTLRGRGVRKGDFVAVHTGRDASYLVALLGAWFAGAAFVPLDARFPAERLGAMVEDANVRVVVHDDRAGVGDFGAETPRVKVPLEGASISDASREMTRGLGRDDLAYVLYTSGSTGRPKGVAITHGNLGSFLSAMTKAPGLAADEPLLALTSFSFDISLLEILLPIWVGGTLVVAHEEALTDPDAVAALVAEHRVAVVQGTPTTFRLLLASPALPPLRRFVGGEAFPRDLAADLVSRGGETWNLYGPTETTIWSTLGRVAAAPTTAVVPLGRPIAGTFLRVADARGRLLPWGARGELLVGGPGVGRGYLGRDALTAERFCTDPTGLSDARVYRTGDAVSLDADGTIAFHGRLDTQVKVRGYRIELGEVEVALRRAAGVTESAAAVCDLGGTPTLVGYVVAPSLDRAALRLRLTEILPAYMVPTFVERLDALPLTGNRKLDRARLPAPLASAPATPMTPTERLVFQAITEAFGTSAIDLDDDFSSLGGFSLSRFSASKRLHQLGVAVEGTALFEFPSVRKLAAHVDAAQRASSPSVAEVSDEDAVSENQVAIALDTHGVTDRWTHTLVSPIHDTVDLARLEAVFRQTFARHADLLSSLRSEGSSVRRVAGDAATLSWEVRREELAPVRVHDERWSGGVVEIIRETSARGFDVARGPLHRFVVVEGRERWLVWATHDTTFDAWSSAVLRKEISLAYEGYETPFPPARRYRAHVLRERQANARLAGELARHYGAPPSPAPAALDAGRAPVARSTVRHPFQPDAVADAAKRLGLGPTVLLEAAFALALARSAHPALVVDPANVAFGVYASNRAVEEELAVGDYDALVPMVLGVDGDASVRDWLAGLVREARAMLRFEAVGTCTWLGHLSAVSRARAWRVRFNDGQFPLTVDALPQPKRTLFATPGKDALVPPPLRLPGVDIEVGAMLYRPFLSAMFDEASVPTKVAQQLLVDLAAMLDRLAGAAPTQPLRALLDR